MLLIKNRIPIVATVLVLIMGFVLVLAQASADDATGSIPSGEFGDNTDVNDPIGWEWESSGNQIRIDIFLDDAWAGLVFGIEAFVNPESSADALRNEDEPMYVQRMGSYGSFPTGRSLCFVFSTSRQVVNDAVGIHLVDRDGDDILISDGLHDNLDLTPASTCTSAQPTPQVVRTPTPGAPPTGDFAPGSGLVLGLIIAGFLLITAGGAYLTQARRLRH